MPASVAWCTSVVSTALFACSTGTYAQSQEDDDDDDDDDLDDDSNDDDDDVV
jgi:hypothetical protein